MQSNPPLAAASAPTDTQPPLRLEILPFLLADGPTHMGWDQALLDDASQHASTAWLRTYAWTEPTLSLGYFQASGEIPDSLKALPVVRRPTGGGAILHSHEITYGLIIPRRYTAAATASSLYELIHGALARWIAGLGLPARRRGPAAVDRKPFLCFVDRDPDDVVVDLPGPVSPLKVVGSAQRRRHGAVLMHGSILLEHAPVVPDLRGLRDLQPELTRKLDHWSSAVQETIAAALRLPFHARDEMPDRLDQAARNLANSVYRNEGWTFRR